MNISEEELDEFKQVYLKLYGKELNSQEAYDKYLKLLCLLQIVYRPIEKQQ